MQLEYFFRDINMGKVLLFRKFLTGDGSATTRLGHQGQFQRNFQVEREAHTLAH